MLVESTVSAKVEKWKMFSVAMRTQNSVVQNLSAIYLLKYLLIMLEDGVVGMFIVSCVEKNINANKHQLIVSWLLPIPPTWMNETVDFFTNKRWHAGFSQMRYSFS